MALQLRRHHLSAIDQLRFEPLATRVRAELGGNVIVDSTTAMLVWEPKRVVASYAVPVEHVSGDLVEASEAEADAAPAPAVSMVDGPPVYDPRTPFHVHTTAGTTLDVRAETGVAARAAFRPDDAELHHVVVLDFAAFDQWREEEAEVVGHPRDPFHRIDVRPSTRHVEVRFEGQTLASSRRLHILTETMLPPRYYFPREDVSMDLLTPSSRRTTCAYKGHASYFSVRDSTDGEHLAWTYPDPLHDAELVKDAVSFFSERVELVVDADPQERPVTPWSR